MLLYGTSYLFVHFRTRGHLYETTPPDIFSAKRFGTRVSRHEEGRLSRRVPSQGALITCPPHGRLRDPERGPEKCLLLCPLYAAIGIRPVPIPRLRCTSRLVYRAALRANQRSCAGRSAS